MNIWEVTAIVCAVGAGASLYGALARKRRDKRRPRCLIVDYSPSVSGPISVNACACNRCKNVVFAQNVEIQPPLFCAYCGQEFAGARPADDDDEFARAFIIPD